MNFNINTSKIPEMYFLKDWIRDNPNAFGGIVEQYKKLITEDIFLGEVALENLEDAKQRMGEKKIKIKNASSLNTVNFIKHICKNKNTLQTVFSQAFNFDVLVLQKLQSMLEKGSEIACNRNEKPIDGDKVWDEVIWGHTQAVNDINPEALIHFVLSHYISQYMNMHLGDCYLLNEKDDFLAVMTDVIIYNEYNSPGQEIYDIWVKEKQEGGLGWINPKQLDIYNEIN